MRVLNDFLARDAAKASLSTAAACASMNVECDGGSPFVNRALTDQGHGAFLRGRHAKCAPMCFAVSVAVRSATEMVVSHISSV